MKKISSGLLAAALVLLAVFVLWTVLILTVDVQPVGQLGTEIGFARLNVRFHSLTGVHLSLYELTDLLELTAILVCLGFCGLGAAQWRKRKRLLAVDRDLLLLGVHFAAVVLVYALFEAVHVNYRPVLIEGKLEGSYPSSTTLLVLAVMPALMFQLSRRVRRPALRRALNTAVAVFTVFMVVGRTVAGVHWLTDILGAVFLAAGLVLLYFAAVFRAEGR